mmetsp:Transcript_16244/g.42191  ORF Transcript_16244/g.42191 Transcript_16244/m.42191 type:complete len:202 (+) Transcript_16244:432-1037(+)
MEASVTRHSLHNLTEKEGSHAGGPALARPSGSFSSTVTMKKCPEGDRRSPTIGSSRSMTRRPLSPPAHAALTPQPLLSYSHWERGTSSSGVGTYGGLNARISTFPRMRGKRALRRSIRRTSTCAMWCACRVSAHAVTAAVLRSVAKHCGWQPACASISASEQMTYPLPQPTSRHMRGGGSVITSMLAAIASTSAKLSSLGS